MIVKEVIQQTESKMKKSIESARREFSEVRTGRAHPGLIEGIHVDYYGTPTMFKELSSISIPDPRTVLIQPWDPSVIPEIEKAITNSKLGVLPSNDGKVVRLNIPPLSEERRHELQKVVKEMAEQSRISLRTIRKDANDKIKKLEHDKAIAEDDGFKAHESIQKLIDKYIKEIDVLLEEKSKALMS
ncbi:MAG: ribosome recycling factor [Omnitrophica WOR_2 bacterium GWF2_38_59]|nr:MAG: ribosome recycling factor [Omnitrophica WOR_2 bacterium GWA2_37_7]OGX23857.1 MAG: ribosome recycling factor [Omnitrophica WOR_2 bacterium GWF2_38_59]OGX47799.1 MAG: ribosome recycling factor [Omnitrophica WOR_2 bacterium RIFOXYA2_FULL_38_17]OGX54433.1 MAG: ribosome recycling factor [Omnitrophica WOR_2 bacterium RIFOXYA12_FULL_38_10]OGX56050.1 MAG: ribosome recycling factor [Omnitrophica WOR_2 bacterium RIFOXYB2_FULL_38_16]OGX56954.1 MAG: ribosome recycling factor [Omnitrophica WOR_2 ba